MKQITCNTPHKQRGVTTLLIALVILVTITWVTFYTSRTVLMEQKISTNEYRGRMAFEAAEAGVEATIAALSQGWIWGPDNDNDGFPDFTGNNIVFDIDGDGTAAGNSNTDQLGNGSSVAVQLNAVFTDDWIQTNIISTGSSDDNTAQRTISQSIVIVPPVPNTPDTPLLAHGGVVIGGAAQVINPEGHSTIWSGGDVNLGANNATATETADPSDPNYPDCLGGSVNCGTVESSNREVVGVDIIEADSSLANLSGDEFFENFFGATPEVFKDTQATIVTNDLVAQDGATSEIIWVDGDTSLDGINNFGTPDEPVIVIVDGDLGGLGNNNFNGLLYVMGDIEGSGAVNVTGAAIVNGVESDAGGAVAVTYSSRILRTLMVQGRPTAGNGSWRDF